MPKIQAEETTIPVLTKAQPRVASVFSMISLIEAWAIAVDISRLKKMRIRNSLAWGFGKNNLFFAEHVGIQLHGSRGGPCPSKSMRTSDFKNFLKRQEFAVLGFYEF